MSTQATLRELLPSFREMLKEKGRSPLTIVAYSTDLEQLIHFLERKQKITPADIYNLDIADFRDTLLAEKYTPKSVSRKLNAVKTFFRWLKQSNMLVSDPSREVEHPKVEISPPRYLQPLEYRALRDAARSDMRMWTIIEVMLQTGIRISELASLKTENIDNLNKKITITAYASQPERETPLNEAALVALNSYRKERPKVDSPYFFVSRTGKPLAVRNIRASIERLMQKAEIQKASVNDLRTTFIIENLKRGVSVTTISEVVGHKRVSTTERYLELAGISESGKSKELEVL